jgi:hypothetical protein
MALPAADSARMDAQKIDSSLLSTLDFDEQGEGKFNRSFVRKFASLLPVGEHADFSDAQNHLSNKGLGRVQNALMGYAFNNADYLSDALENSRSKINSINGGLQKAAPAIAKIKAEIAQQRLPAEVDISNNLVEAALLVNQAKNTQLEIKDAEGNPTGQKRSQFVKDLMDNQDMLNPIPPLTQRLVQLFFSDKDLSVPATKVNIGGAINAFSQTALQGSQASLAGLESGKPLVEQAL